VRSYEEIAAVFVAPGDHQFNLDSFARNIHDALNGRRPYQSKHVRQGELTE
jgi:hypothetical protein